jgi:hypothetical protein
MIYVRYADWKIYFLPRIIARIFFFNRNKLPMSTGCEICSSPQIRENQSLKCELSCLNLARFRHWGIIARFDISHYTADEYVSLYRKNQGYP